MNLLDPHPGLRDLQLAVQALASALRKSGDPARAALHDAAQRLRSQGAGSSARLLEGEPAEAAYRR